ncbi:MAG: hypothetical protein U5L45_26650 [Saprospiraceae bacterium]|nr:hypothetical protein [Saprospiraceae bacterium]
MRFVFRALPENQLASLFLRAKRLKVYSSLLFFYTERGVSIFVKLSLRCKLQQSVVTRQVNSSL